MTDSKDTEIRRERVEDFPRMKYCVFDVWFRVTTEHDLEGPFLSETEARDP
jgi:hypothetical protein